MIGSIFILIGLLLDAIGAFLIIRNSPENTFEPELGDFRGLEGGPTEREANVKNSRIRIGLYFILAGFSLQLIGTAFQLLVPQET